MEKPSPVLERQLDCYVRMVAEEAWKTDHQLAMACRDLERVLSFGLAIYEGIVQAEEELRELALRGKHEDAEHVMAGIHDLVRWWLTPCEAAGQAIKGFQDQGYEVEHSAEFRRARREAQWLLKEPREAFSHARLAAARDAAIDASRNGDVVEIERISD